jgi:hypothetical protein
MDRLPLNPVIDETLDKGRFSGLPLQPVFRVLQAAAQHRPQAAQRASDALGTILVPLLQSPWQDVAWQFSRLTGDGYPVELTYCSHDTTLRYTAEVAGPEYPDSLRLARGREVLSVLGVSQVENPILDVLGRMQAGHELRYGAWLSGRHTAERDQYKLYAEVPADGSPEAEALLDHFLNRGGLVLRPRDQLLMIGHEIGSGRTEFYFRVHHLDDIGLQRLMNQIGLSDQVSTLLTFIEAITGRPIHRFFPQTNIGFSLSWQDKVPVLTLGVSARSVFGGDASIRHKLLHLARRYDWPLLQSGYALATQPLATLANHWKTCHGLLGLTVAAGGAPVLSVGLRPCHET